MVKKKRFNITVLDFNEQPIDSVLDSMQWFDKKLDDAQRTQVIFDGYMRYYNKWKVK